MRACSIIACRCSCPCFRLGPCPCQAPCLRSQPSQPPPPPPPRPPPPPPRLLGEQRVRRQVGLGLCLRPHHRLGVRLCSLHHGRDLHLCSLRGGRLAAEPGREALVVALLSWITGLLRSPLTRGWTRPGRPLIHSRARTRHPTPAGNHNRAAPSPAPRALYGCLPAGRTTALEGVLTAGPAFKVDAVASAAHCTQPSEDSAAAWRKRGTASAGRPALPRAALRLK